MKDAGIEEGDLVHVRPLRPGTEPPDGAIVLAEVGLLEVVGERSGRVTIKRFSRHGDMIQLRPANRLMRPRKYAPDDIAIRGIVVNALRRIRPLS